MLKYLAVILISCLLIFQSCKKEETVSKLKETYEPKLQPAEDVGADFTVRLNASALRENETGEWKIISGKVVTNFVFFEDKNNPFTNFRGIPGEEYQLEWNHKNAAGKITKLNVTVKINPLIIDIKEITSSNFSTIRTLAVDPKYRGIWAFDKPYGHLNSRYFDGYATPITSKPIIDLHGYSNTQYTATYTYVYANQVYRFQKVTQTGDYTEDEGLFELQMSRGSTFVIENRAGNILELDMQASGIAYKFNESTTYPALNSFKRLRKLILGGSSIRQIPTILGDSYLNLEELDLDGVGENLTFPDNFGNLNKLKSLIVEPMYSTSVYREIFLPKSFANLKSLESFTASRVAYINFNGTLGGLTSLKFLNVKITHLSDDIGLLKQLEKLYVLVKSPVVPAGLSSSTGLIDIRLNFIETPSGRVELPSTIGNLKKLESLLITTKMLFSLPESFSALSSLKSLTLEGVSIEYLPENFGNLTNLENLILYGKFKKLPNSICNLGKLSVFLLGGVIENLPNDFGNLTSLTYLNAQNIPLKVLPESFGNLRSLKEIVFSNCKIETLPTSFGALEKLEKLNLAYNQFRTFPKALISLNKINTIILNGNQVGDIPDDISKMKIGVLFHLNQVPNLTRDRINYLVSIAKGKAFITDFGIFGSIN